MSALAVQRRDGAYPLDDVVRIFKANGLVILREFLAPSTRDALRALLEDKLAAADRRNAVLRLPIYPNADFLLGDVLSVRELERYEYIFFRQELLDVIRALLDTRELVYFGDSSVQFGEGGRGFHKDNVDRYDGTSDDWKGDYGLIRCGFYLQDHVTHSGGLKIRLGSHEIPTHTRGKMADVRTRYGDMVLWSMRLTHSGNNRRIRWLRSVTLHPRLEMLLPAILMAPEQSRRISAFCAFGRPGLHADRYIRNLANRTADYKEYLRRARRRGEAEAIVSRLGVSLRPPDAYYGDLD